MEEELHNGRTQGEFETIVSDRFEIMATKTLGEGTRVLYNLRPKLSA
jgi:hypothetical protein